MNETQLVPERKFSRNVVSVEPLRLKEFGFRKCSMCGCKIKGDSRVLAKFLAAGLCRHCFYKQKRMHKLE